LQIGHGEVAAGTAGLIDVAVADPVVEHIQRDIIQRLQAPVRLFVAAAPDILQTLSSVHLRDDEMHAEDLWHFRRVGEKGTQLTGYPAISVYEEFRYHPKQVIGGVFDWVYEHLGLFSWVVEIWSPMKEAGIENYKYIDWFRDHPIEDDLKLYRWNVDKLAGVAHIPWRSFDHPQLGAVEIGGWDFQNYWRNPPPHLREREDEAAVVQRKSWRPELRVRG
jgi:murein tripeptide amidase MpaA